MSFEFDFVPHNVNNAYQELRKTTSFAKHLLTKTNNSTIWNLFISIDIYSLCVNKNDAIYKVIDIISIIKHLIPFYASENKLTKNEIKEIKHYDLLLAYLQNRLITGKKIKQK